MSGITPWVAGQTSPTWTITCQRDGSVYDLTGQLASYISILFYNNVFTATVNGQRSFTRIGTGVGSVTITSASTGVITYAPASADTLSLTPGQYWVRVEVNVNGTNPDYCDYLPIFIGA